MAFMPLKTAPKKAALSRNISPSLIGSFGRNRVCRILQVRNTLCYANPVIRTFRHGGIEAFFRTGSKAGIQPKHETRLRILLTTLHLASTPFDMNRPGWDCHLLKGDLRGHWSVKVNGNWRLTFAFEEQDAILVDYQDYH